MAMEKKPERGEGTPAEKLIFSRDQEMPPTGEPASDAPPLGPEPQGIQKGIADADKRARTGSTEEAVRNTPPAGAWNDTSGD